VESPPLTRLWSIGTRLVVVSLAGLLAACIPLVAPAKTVPSTPPVAQIESACATFDSRIWAQAVFDDDPGAHAALDPDWDGLACEALPPGAAPALWTDTVPAAAIPADLASVTDGDTIEVIVNGRLEAVRLVGVDAPEAGGPYRDVECFGLEGADFLTWLVRSGGTLFIEKDQEERDRFDRLLRWVWLDRGDGEVYLLNEALIRAGYAERFRDTPNRRYVGELIAAESFARQYELGFWAACNAGLTTDVVLPPVPPMSDPDAPCDPAYPDVCILSPPPDLECSDIPHTRFRAFPPDPHNFDGNRDGMACEGPT